MYNFQGGKALGKTQTQNICLSQTMGQGFKGSKNIFHLKIPRLIPKNKKDAGGLCDPTEKKQEEAFQPLERKDTFAVNERERPLSIDRESNLLHQSINQD